MKNKNKYVLYFIAFFQGLVFYGAFATIFRLNRGLQLSDIFFLESIFVILMMIFEIPWGIIGDKLGYKKTLIMSYGIFLLSKIAFYYAHSFSGFLLEAILGAIAISGISGCDSAILYSSIDKDDSEKIFGRYGAFGTAGFLVSSLISGIMVEHSLDLLAFATIIPYIIAFILSFFLIDIKIDDGERREGIKDTFKLAFTNKRILIFIIGIAVLSETTHSICVFLNQPLYIKSGIDMKWFGILTALMQVATFISIKSHKIKRYMGDKSVYLLSIILVIVSNVFLIFSSSWYVTIILIFIIEGAFALTQPLTETIKNKSINSLNRATILSSYAMIGNIVSAISNGIIGITAEISLQAALICCVVLNFMVIGIMYFAIRNLENTNIKI